MKTASVSFSRFIVCAAICNLNLAHVAFAENASLLDTVLSKNSNYSSSQKVLLSAQNKLNQAQNDPLITDVELANLQSMVRLNQSKVWRNQWLARKTALSAFFGYQEAQIAFNIEQMQNQVANIQYKANQVKFKNGLLNKIDAQKSEQDFKSAQASLQSAQKLVSDRKNKVVNIFGQVPDSIDSLKTNYANDRLSKTPELDQDVISAQADLNQAQLTLDSLSEDTTSANEITAAQSALQNAKLDYINAVQAANEARSEALSNYQDSLQALADIDTSIVENEYAAQKNRFAKGSIAKVALMSSEITLNKAWLAKRKAEYAIQLAILDVYATYSVK